MNRFNHPKVDEELLFREMRKASPYLEVVDDFRPLTRDWASTGVEKVPART